MSRPSPERLSRIVRWLPCLLAGSALLSACGGRNASVESQIAAKVNKGEISVHQVQAIIQRQPAQIAGDQTERAAARVLDVLIDQEVAAQAARELGLERDPRMVQSVEAARRELLAHAYQEQIAAKIVSPSSDEVDRYYDDNPALFAQRRLYVLQEATVEATAGQVGKLQELMARTRSVDDVGQILGAAGLRYNARLLANAAEDLPLTLLAAVSKLEIGQSWVRPEGEGARIYTVVYAQAAPMPRRAAANAIGNYLLTDRKRQAVAQAMKGLRDAAKVEYLGNFARLQGAAASAPGAGAN
jgi:EpsD family peptidyl-prolyl cis-trans isomerase